LPAICGYCEEYCGYWEEYCGYCEENCGYCEEYCIKGVAADGRKQKIRLGVKTRTF